MELFDLLQHHKKGKLSYTESVALFFKIFPQKETFLGKFLAQEDELSWKKVRSGLDEKLSELETNAEANKFKSFVPSKFASTPLNLQVLPEELRKEHAKLSPIIREISSLHARLYNCSTNDQRYELASRIIDLVAQRRAIFTAIDSYALTGKQEEVVVEHQEKVDPSKLKNFESEYKLKLLRSKASKLKKKPNRKSDYDQVLKEINELKATRYV